MTIYTIYSKANDHSVRSQDATWTTARSGGGTLLEYASTDLVCNSYDAGSTFQAWESFLEFDLSGVPTDTPNAVSFVCKWALSGVAITYRIAEASWTGGTGDFIPGADLSVLPEFATFTAVTTTTQQTISSSANPARVSDYKLIFYSQSLESATPPSATSTRSFYSADRAGTSDDPKITMDVTRKLSAAVGTFVLTGQAVTVHQTRASSVGTFTLTGQDIAMRYGKILHPEAGAFVLVGNVATFPILRAPPTERTITFDASTLNDTRTLIL